MSCQEEGKKESLGEFLVGMDVVLVSNKKKESRLAQDTRAIGFEESLLGEFSISIKFQQAGNQDLWLSTVYGPNIELQPELVCKGKTSMWLDFFLKCLEGRVTKNMKDFNTLIHEFGLKDLSYLVLILHGLIFAMILLAIN